MGTACKRIAVERGLGGAEPGSRATYIIMFHLYFDSVEAFQAAFGPHAPAIMGDIPNYTDIQPTIQVSEVKM
ncbi:MAG: EthD family reductase [Syntrophales bacterium]